MFTEITIWLLTHGHMGKVTHCHVGARNIDQLPNVRLAHCFAHLEVACMQLLGATQKFSLGWQKNGYRSTPGYDAAYLVLQTRPRKKVWFCRRICFGNPKTCGVPFGVLLTRPNMSTQTSGLPQDVRVNQKVPLHGMTILGKTTNMMILPTK